MAFSARIRQSDWKPDMSVLKLKLGDPVAVPYALVKAFFDEIERKFAQEITTNFA
jgi:hypothetical protein